ncbi:MAG: GNAT family N-acetyltransferase [Oscillospiraceae bacterium]|nr:GNAT family N-acetyltransferase [Oscillospiraceae bacterium]
MEITVREIQEADSAAIAELARTSLGYDCDEELVNHRIISLKNDNNAMFCAEYDGEVIGFIHAHIYEVLYFDTMINILGLAVSEKYRRMGAGSLLLKRIEEWGRERNVKGVRLNSGGQRTWAHEFYRKAGYDNEKVQMRFIKNFR